MLVCPLTLLLVAGPGPGAREVGVLPLEVEGELTGAQRRTLRSKVSKRLREVGRVVGPKRVAELSPDARACPDAACWRDVAERTKARHLLDVRVTRSGPDYDLELRLIEGSSGERVASDQRRCEICGFTEMSQTLAEMVGSMGRRLGEESLTAQLVVRSTPARATVRLGDEVVGTTPLDLPVAPGPRTISIRRLGHIAQRRPIALVAGTTSHVDVTLQPTPRTRMRQIGWVSLGLGLAAMGAGVPLLALDGREHGSRCTDDDVGPDGECSIRYETMAPGVSLAVVGGALLGAATSLLVVGHLERRGSARLTVAPSGLGLEGRF